jgi:hypothetical protein
VLSATAGQARAEPPQPPGFSCRVTQQRVQDGMSLEVEFGNTTGAPLSLAPGPHLVWYHDAAAEDPMEHTARAGRIQNLPLLLPAGSSRKALLAFTPAALDALRCNGVVPAGAALYFYQFNPWPSFRCLLQGYALDAVLPRSSCPPGVLHP